MVRVPPPPPVPKGLTWRNAAYALQWWVFAAFAVFMYLRMLRDETLAERARRTGEQEPEPLGDNGPRESPRTADLGHP